MSPSHSGSEKMVQRSYFGPGRNPGPNSIPEGLLWVSAAYLLCH